MTHAMVCRLVCDCTGTLSSLPCVFPGCQGHVHPQCSPGSSFQTTSDPPSLLFFGLGMICRDLQCLGGSAFPNHVHAMCLFIANVTFLAAFIPSLLLVATSCGKIIWNLVLELVFITPLQVMRKMTVLLLFIYKSAKQCWGTCSAQGAVQIPT